MTNILRQVVLVISLTGLLQACGVPQQSLTADFIPVPESLTEYSLQDEVRIRAPNADTTVLKSGTVWVKTGSIELGDVFRSADQVVIVNSFNVREGHIVIRDGTVVGYFLPVEKTFVEVKATPIILHKKEH